MCYAYVIIAIERLVVTSLRYITAFTGTMFCNGALGDEDYTFGVLYTY